MKLSSGRIRAKIYFEEVNGEEWLEVKRRARGR